MNRQLFFTIYNTPPDVSLWTDGDRFLIGTAPTDAFENHANEIAILKLDAAGQWDFDQPDPGQLLLSLKDERWYDLIGGVWTPVTGSEPTDVLINHGASVYEIPDGYTYTINTPAILIHVGDLEINGVLEIYGRVEGLE